MWESFTKAVCIHQPLKDWKVDSPMISILIVTCFRMAILHLESLIVTYQQREIINFITLICIGI